MDARSLRSLVLLLLPAMLGASYPTANFVIDAPTAEIAKKVGEAAEVYRKELAIEWLGQELPKWRAPCPVKVRVGQIAASGETRFSFFPDSHGPAEVGSWDMRINGPLDRVLDSVLPHEVSHTIFACYFRRPLPRWADEGAATLAEIESERRRQVMTVNQVLKTGRRISFKNLLNMKEYPRDYQDMLTLYAEGYVLADLLVQEGGKKRYLNFLTEANRTGWDQAIEKHYGYKGVEALEKRWHGWVIAGCPEIKLPDGQMLAKNKSTPEKSAVEGFVLRGQSPPDEEPSQQQPGVNSFPPHKSTERNRTIEVVDASPPRPLPLARKLRSEDRTGSMKHRNNNPNVDRERIAETDRDADEDEEFETPLPRRGSSSGRNSSMNRHQLDDRRESNRENEADRNTATRPANPERNTHSEFPAESRSPVK